MTFLPRALRCVLLAGAALGATPSLAMADEAPTVSSVLVQPEALRPDRPLSVQTIEAGRIAATVNATTAEDALTDFSQAISTLSDDSSFSNGMGNHQRSGQRSTHSARARL